MIHPVPPHFAHTVCVAIASIIVHAEGHGGVGLERKRADRREALRRISNWNDPWTRTDQTLVYNDLGYFWKVAAAAVSADRAYAPCDR